MSLRYLDDAEKRLYEKRTKMKERELHEIITSQNKKLKEENLFLRNMVGNIIVELRCDGIYSAEAWADELERQLKERS